MIKSHQGHILINIFPLKYQHIYYRVNVTNKQTNKKDINIDFIIAIESMFEIYLTYEQNNKIIYYFLL